MCIYIRQQPYVRPPPYIYIYMSERQNLCTKNALSGTGASFQRPPYRLYCFDQMDTYPLSFAAVCMTASMRKQNTLPRPHVQKQTTPKQQPNNSMNQATPCGILLLQHINAKTKQRTQILSNAINNLGLGYRFAPLPYRSTQFPAIKPTPKFHLELPIQSNLKTKVLPAALQPRPRAQLT